MLEVDRDEYPCIGSCTTTSQGDKMCRGCGRTDYEVIYWNVFNRQKRLIKTIEARERLQDGNSSSSNRTN